MWQSALLQNPYQERCEKEKNGYKTAVVDFLHFST